MSAREAGGTPSILKAISRFVMRPRRGVEADDPRARSWAHQLKSPAEIPPIYEPFARELGLASGEPFPYTILTPTFRGGYGRPELERLLCIIGHHVHIAEVVDSRLRVLHFSPADVSFLERGSILLHAWITIAGLGEGRLIKIRYNSVTDPIMLPFVEMLRVPVSSGKAVDPGAEKQRFRFLAEQHFKFMSYGEGCLRPGAEVQAILLQPQINREVMRLGGFSLVRLVWPAHLTVLTDGELVLIRDDDSQRWTRGTPHGAIWTYIDRARIAGADLSPAKEGRLMLSIRLSGGQTIQALFEAGGGTELDELVSRLAI